MSLFSTFESFSIKLLKVLLSACLLTPLLAFSGMIFPYTAPKAFTFRVLVEIAAIFYLYLALKYPAHFLPVFVKKVNPPRPPLQGGSEFMPPFRKSFPFLPPLRSFSSLMPPLRKGGLGGLNLAALIFLSVNILSAIFGLDFYTSFWGNLERGIGVWGLMHFVVWFFMLAGVMKADAILTSPAPLYKGGQNSSPPYAKGGWGVKFIQVSVFTSVLVAVSALIQRLGGLGGLLPPADRIYGLIGNAGIFASYLIFNIFLAGYLFLSEVVILSEAKNLDRMGESRICERSFGRSPQDDRNSYFWISIYSLFIIINLFVLLLSGTRGAYLGLLAGIIVFLIISVIKNLWGDRKNLPPPYPLCVRGAEEGACASRISVFTPLVKGGWGVRIPAVILLVIFIFVGVLFLARDNAFIKNNSTLSRLTSFSLSDITIQSRLLLWQESWRAWQSRPILGFGPENFSIAANKYFDARLAKYEAYSFDRAHNFIFDHGVETGWLGLLSYLMMIGAAGWALVLFVIPAPHQVWDKLQRKSEIYSSLSVKGGGEGFSSKPESLLIFLSLLVAYFVQNFFIFDSFVSYLMLFFTLAIINDIHCYSSMSVIPAEVADPDARRVVDPDARRVVDPDARRAGIHPAAAGRVKSWTTKKIILIFFTVLIIFSLYSFNLKPFYAAYLANQILSLPAADAAQAVPLLKDALDLNTFASSEIAYQAAVDYIDKIAQEPALAQNEEFYSAASNALIKIIKNSPSQSRNYIALAWLDLYFSGKNPQRINEALNLGDKILALSPAKKDAFLILVAGYALSNQSQKAEEIILRAQAVDGKMGEEVKAYYDKLK